MALRFWGRSGAIHGFELPVIVFTDQERMVDVERALSLGANDYIKKAQMEPEEVLEKIKRYVTGNLNDEDGFHDDRMVHEGDAAIVKKYDVPHFARFTHISGDFLLESVDGLELDFPQLVEVGGDLVIGLTPSYPTSARLNRCSMSEAISSLRTMTRSRAWCT